MPWRKKMFAGKLGLGAILSTLLSWLISRSCAYFDHGTDVLSGTVFLLWKQLFWYPFGLHHGWATMDITECQKSSTCIMLAHLNQIDTDFGAF